MKTNLIPLGLAALLALAPLTSQGQLKEVPELAEIMQEQQDYFPGDAPKHHVVYMFNQSDKEYQLHILNSIKAMLIQFGGNVEIAVVAIGPGIHTLTKKPKKAVDTEVYERIQGMAETSGVRFIACGNTMNTVGYSQDDMRPFAEYALVGAAAIMALQEKGFSAITW